MVYKHDYESAKEVASATGYLFSQNRQNWRFISSVMPYILFIQAWFLVIFYAISCIMTFVISIFLSLDFQKQLLALHAKTRIRTFDEKTGLKDQIQSIKGRQFSKTWMI